MTNAAPTFAFTPACLLVNVPCVYIYFHNEGPNANANRDPHIGKKVLNETPSHPIAICSCHLSAGTQNVTIYPSVIRSKLSKRSTYILVIKE